MAGISRYGMGRIAPQIVLLYEGGILLETLSHPSEYALFHAQTWVLQHTQLMYVHSKEGPDGPFLGLPKGSNMPYQSGFMYKVSSAKSSVTKDRSCVCKLLQQLATLFNYTFKEAHESEAWL